MKKLKYRFLYIVSFTSLVFIIIWGCKHEIIVPDNYGYQGKPNFDTVPVTPPPTVVTHPCSPDSVYFESQILPILISNCSNCHKSGGGELKSLLTYTDVMNSKYVKAGNPSGSKLYNSLSSGSEDIMPPSPANPLSSGQKDMIRKWIQQGAKNLTCDYCDTSKYTFSGAVYPIIQNYCFGCHKSPSPSGGIYLETYAQIKTLADIQKLMCTVSHSTGCSAMPPAVKLQDCQISQIQKWINNGAKND